MQDKIRDAIQLGKDLEYLKEEFEFNNQLYGSAPDGYVTLQQMIAYCKENDYLLEHIIKIAKEINK